LVPGRGFRDSRDFEVRRVNWEQVRRRCSRSYSEEVPCLGCLQRDWQPRHRLAGRQNRVSDRLDPWERRSQHRRCWLYWDPRRDRRCRPDRCCRKPNCCCRSRRNRCPRNPNPRTRRSITAVPAIAGARPSVATSISLRVEKEIVRIFKELSLAPSSGRRKASRRGRGGTL
jgi:hypothetical protein